jgi:hypothetical protein
MKFRTMSLFGALIGLAVLTLSLTLTAQTKDSKTQEPKTTTKSTVKLHPLDIKTGLWETTRTYTMAGVLPIPADRLARLNPEQRARLEERMKAHAAANTQTVTDQTCITKKDLEDGDYAQNKKECTQTILSSSSTQASGTLACEMEGIKFNGSLEVYAVDQEHFKGSAHSTATGNGNTRNVDIAFTSKWLGASCSQ